MTVGAIKSLEWQNQHFLKMQESTMKESVARLNARNG